MAGEKKPSRTEKRSRGAKEIPPPAAVLALPDEAMQKAAMVLARTGYKKSANRRNGAVTFAARVADVDRTTIYNWLNDELFMTAIEEAKTRLLTIGFEGLEIGAFKGDHRCSVELIAQVEPDFDRQWLREQARMAHDERMLRLRIELAEKEGPDDVPEPDFSFEETGPGERRAEEDMH
jgi:hypothetical protein